MFPPCTGAFIWYSLYDTPLFCPHFFWSLCVAFMWCGNIRLDWQLSCIKITQSCPTSQWKISREILLLKDHFCVFFILKYLLLVLYVLNKAKKVLCISDSYPVLPDVPPRCYQMTSSTLTRHVPNVLILAEFTTTTSLFHQVESRTKLKEPKCGFTKQWEMNSGPFFLYD